LLVKPASRHPRRRPDTVNPLSRQAGEILKLLI